MSVKLYKLKIKKYLLVITGFCANKATAAFMDHETKKIVHMEVGAAVEVEGKSARWVTNSMIASIRLPEQCYVRTNVYAIDLIGNIQF